MKELEKLTKDIAKHEQEVLNIEAEMSRLEEKRNGWLGIIRLEKEQKESYELMAKLNEK